MAPDGAVPFLFVHELQKPVVIYQKYVIINRDANG